jgi:ABC-type phosphate transport system permease subunit
MSVLCSLFQVFWHVTLPNIRWGLLYGVILTNARALGEFGAVSVISGEGRRGGGQLLGPGRWRMWCLIFVQHKGREARRAESRMAGA